MDSKKGVKRAFKVVACGALIMGVATWLLVRNIEKKEIAHMKPYDQIVMDADSFGADMEVAKNLSKQNFKVRYLRFAYKENEPIIVTYQNEMEDREVQIIEKAIKYYNDLFKTINDKISFELIPEQDVKDKANFTINIQNATLAKNEGGLYIIKDNDTYLNKGNIVSKAKINIAYDFLKSYKDSYIYYVVLHELGHSLGLGDVYYQDSNKVQDDLNGLTFMNTINNDESDRLLPNDYAILQALYSDEYKYHDNYQEAVDVVNEKIKEYTNKFYDYYAGVIKERYAGNPLGKVVEMDEELAKKIDLNWTYKRLDDRNYSCSLKVVDDNRACLTIKDENGNLLEESYGDITFNEGILFIKGIQLNSVDNYREGFFDGAGKFIMYVYLNNNNSFFINDNLSTVRIHSCQNRLNKNNSR